jgi:hypothetical protein
LKSRHLRRRRAATTLDALLLGPRDYVTLSITIGSAAKTEDSKAARAQNNGDWPLAVALDCSVAAPRPAATTMFATTQAD